ncbi:MAG: ATP-binding protein [Chloroflexota bacterium]|nr:ATP-binding protein [Chloroflexota bacterium]
MMSTPVRHTNLEYLLSELRRVTALVSSRVQQMGADKQTEEDEFQGLYVSEDEINQLLSDPNLFLSGSYDADLGPKEIVADVANSRLSHLQRVLGLSPFELDVLLIALAPELDLRYERLYAYLQDDITRRRPSVDLVLRLFCPGLAGQVAARRCFDLDAPLLKYRIIELSEENQNRQPSLLARSIKLDEGIVAYLLGESKLDVRLRGIAEFADIEKSRLVVAEVEGYVTRLVELVAETKPGSSGFLCVLLGADEISKLNLAIEVCVRQELSPVVVNTTILPGLPRLESLLQLLEREARLRSAPIYWASYEALLKEESAPAQEAKRLVERLLKEQTGLSFISTIVPLPPALTGQKRREFQLSLSQSNYTERQNLWENQLGVAALELDLESLSSRFRLNSGQIVAAAATAYNLAAWRGETIPTLVDLEAACRHHSSQRLSSLARKITPCYRWEDIVLPVDQYNMLREIYEQVKHRSLVYEKWGFDRKIALGKGLNVVFAGPSGTGKTMSAEIIASGLHMDLYKIDLSTVVSKYIGETEKNLERIFTEAGESNAILFFDEADSIFGKRSEVKDAHDRYANIETGYLLQKMEEYDGIVILATNLRKNLDDAFVRRMHFIIEYPFPEEEDRFEIWRRVFPTAVPLDISVDLHFMARQFKIAGGNIKNIALTAAFLAASDNFTHAIPKVEMAHLIRATRREYQKMGKLCTQSDFGPYFSLLNDFTNKKRGVNGLKV